MNRYLIDLAMRGYQFPGMNTFQNVASMPTKPRTYPSVKVRVVKAHYQLRRLLAVGEIVSLPEPDALNAIALKRAERI